MNQKINNGTQEWGGNSSHVTLITSKDCWMEQNALDQLNAVGTLTGVTRVVGLPDLHAGKTPIGAVIDTDGIIYPHLIGNDIGCGMGLFRTGIEPRRFRQERLVTRLNHIRELADLNCQNPYPEESPIYDLGTIGGGNHFVEFQVVHQLSGNERLEELELKKGEILLLVHSGSRGYGQRILNEFSGFAGLSVGSEEAEGYLLLHEDALLWAKRNRGLVAELLVDYLGFKGAVEPLLDCPHNFIQRVGSFGIRHRKGAVCAEQQLVVLPGSRGSLTYLVQPTEDEERLDYCLSSLSHGAGRKWARSLCKSRIRNKYDRESIRRTDWKSQVVCHDTELLYQEAPEAYKNIETVLEALEAHHLIQVVAALRPLITFKG